MSMTTGEKLSALRDHMSKHDLDFYYVPTSDPHNNEYLPSCWDRRAWLTGFDGSYGDALVGINVGYLWTDPRYYLQATDQLDAAHFKMMKQSQGVSAPISQWLSDHAKNAVIGVDPKLISAKAHRIWTEKLAKSHSELTAVPDNLVDLIWQDQPDLSLTPVSVWSSVHAGLSAKEKMQQVRAFMKSQGVDAMVITTLDDIAWLFNIRANDIPFNPVVISYAILTPHEAILYTDMQRVFEETFTYFSDQEIALDAYDNFAIALSKLKGPVLLDPATASWWVAMQLDHTVIVERPSVITQMKAVKNKTELAGMHEAHRIDALAMVKFIYWLEHHWQEGIDEVQAADQLEAFRREDSRCKGLSFATICGFAGNGAIVHYHAGENTKKVINDQHLLLVDSGGQYEEGTTDITRTMHLGRPTAEEKRHYTLVLKGHLALRHAYFPHGTTGEAINALARVPLWNEGMDFGHGTGHGVGCYLCVHEGPQRISAGFTGVALVPGMIVSNEPGLYFSDKYGIRIENLCAITEAVSVKQSPTGHGPFYTMEDLTLVPYARRLIDTDLLSAEEISWVNDYHQKVLEKLSPDLSGELLDWLKAATKPLD